MKIEKNSVFLVFFLRYKKRPRNNQKQKEEGERRGRVSVWFLVWEVFLSKGFVVVGKRQKERRQGFCSFCWCLVGCCFLVLIGCFLEFRDFIMFFL